MYSFTHSVERPVANLAPNHQEFKSFLPSLPFLPNFFLSHLLPPNHPNHQWWHAKMAAQSEYMRIAYTVFFAHFRADSQAQSALVNKNFCIGAQEEVY